MKKYIFLLVMVAFAGHIYSGNSDVFETYFKNKTMRVDYFHSGTATEEHFAVDRIVSDGQWAGSITNLVDKLNLGLYQFEIVDLESGVKIYSRGFASVFGEWQSIPEAGEQWGTFHESIRFPWPLKPVKLIMKKRDAKNNFATIWETTIDPASRKVNPADLISAYTTKDFLINGPVNEKVDVVILGDGYTKDEMGKYDKDVERLTDSLFKVEPFKSRKNDFNIRIVETPSATSGVSKPHPGVFNRTPLSVHYSSFDSERYALSYDNRAIREAASAVPYDFMFLLINEKTYGGGGIYQLYASVAVDNQFADYIFIHEFGHHFAALADEYYTSSVSYQMPEITIEPWERNITALLDKNNLKWKELVQPGTPIPTPWNKEEFDQHAIKIQRERDSLRAAKSPESVLENLFNKQKKEETRMIKQMENNGKVGAFEGASYYQFGMYRPTIDCIMFSRNSNNFCPVCQQAISDVIDQYVK